MDNNKKTKLLVVSREPTPYKTDCFNAFAKNKNVDLIVYYACSKDWAVDAGHDFRLFPDSLFENYQHKGKGVIGNIFSSFRIVSLILQKKPDAILVCGYSGLPYICSMLSATIAGIPFALQADQFNADTASVKPVHLWLRNIIRKYVFSQSIAVLTCGKPGKQSAITAQCPPDKIVDFPYVIDGKRLKRLASEYSHNNSGIEETETPIIFFSGRLIERKGLDILLKAVRTVKELSYRFTLVIEGDGPLRTKYEAMTRELDVDDVCVLVGFCQMDQHAYLLSKADIVVVPSLQDNWGLAVHEAMLMGKPVCASNAVGSAVDRIDNENDGLLYDATDNRALSSKIIYLLESAHHRKMLGKNAEEKANKYSPDRNVDNFLRALKDYRTRKLMRKKSLQANR